MFSFIRTKMSANIDVLIFFVLLILHISPLFTVDILLTLDGPSHLYNANIFNNLIANNPYFKDLYEINNELVPNYTGHLLLSLFLLFLSPILALKVIHIIYIFGIAISFRMLVLSLNPRGGLMSVIIFPFIYSSLFFYGFYNFSIAIVFLFITTRYWILNYKRNDYLFYVSLITLFLLTYLSHSFTFLFLCVTIGIFIIVESLDSKNYINILTLGIKSFLLALPSIVLGLFFVSNRESSNYYFKTSDELWTNLINLSFLKKFENGETFYFLLFLLVTLLLIQIKCKTNIKNRNYTFAFLSIISIILYFFMPDGIGYAGFFSDRLSYMSILFILVWLSIQKFSNLKIWIVVICVFVFQIMRTERLKVWAIEKNNKAKEVIEVGELIPSNSIIKPITSINTWQFLHLSSFLGVNRPQIILDNYEANHNYFPVKWKNNLENASRNKDDDFFNIKLNNKVYKINYLIIIGKRAVENINHLKQIKYAENNFELTYKSSFVTLYRVN